MFTFLLLCLLALLLIAGFMLWYMGLIRKFGLPELPPDIETLDNQLAGSGVMMDTGGYRPDREKDGRKTVARIYQTKDGVWDVVLELEGELIIAYQAMLKHSGTRWLNSTREKWVKEPRIIRIIGNG
jgi:hypothetical protein